MEVYTLKERLIRIFNLAGFEIEIVSPLIKRQTWENIKVSVARFIKKGGSLRVFVRRRRIRLLEQTEGRHQRRSGSNGGAR